MTRRRVAGVVLALALAGALSAGVASGVERVRGKGRKRPEPPPPFSQRDKAWAREDASSGRGVRREAATLLAPDGPSVAAVSGASASRGRREGRPTEARVAHGLPASMEGGEPPEPASKEAAVADSHAEAHGGPLPGLTARIPAPMRVSWTVVESSAGRVRLVAEVERRRGFGAPVAVHLALPRAARLLEGPEDFTVPEGPGGDVRAVSYVVTFGPAAVPTEDLVLVAHAEGASFGAYAEERYAFGRAPTAAPRPVPAGPVLPGSLMRGEEPGTPGSDSEESTP